MTHDLWRDAAGILETAAATGQADSGRIAILIDRQNGVRIVDGSGWHLEALRHEYQTATAFMVERTSAGLKVCAQRGNESCTFQKQNPARFLAPFSTAVPRHLLESPRPALAN